MSQHKHLIWQLIQSKDLRNRGFLFVYLFMGKCTEVWEWGWVWTFLSGSLTLFFTQLLTSLIVRISKGEALIILQDAINLGQWKCTQIYTSYIYTRRKEKKVNDKIRMKDVKYRTCSIGIDWLSRPDRLADLTFCIFFTILNICFLIAEKINSCKKKSINVLPTKLLRWLHLTSNSLSTANNLHL